MERSAHILPSRLLILLLALSSAFLLFVTRVEASQTVALEEYVVARGDTLWSIAAGITPAGDDVRTWVSVLEDLNDVTASELRPGQRLQVPDG